MKHRYRKNLVIIALWGGAVLSLAWTVAQSRVAAAAQAEVEGLRTTRAGLERQLREQEQQATAFDQELQEMQATLTRQQGSTVPSTVDSRRAAPVRPRESAVSAMRDPVLQNLLLAVDRTALAGRYAPVVCKLGLTAPQAEKLEALIHWRNEQQMDLDDIVRANRLSDRDPAVVKLREKTIRSFRVEVENLIGQPAYEELIQHERALPVWELVNQFAGAVALEGNPLTETQATQLTETLAVSSQPYREGGEADTNAIDWPVVLPETTRILTPPQQVSFRNMAPMYPIPAKNGAPGAPSLVGPPSL